jgi:hypothetical protein
MKRITVKNKNNVVTHSIELENHIDWITEAESKNHFGIPERIVEAIEGTYDPADVLEEIDELVSPEVLEVLDENGVVAIPASPAIFKKMVKLKAEYAIEIIDITAEHDLQECISKRKAEYPTMEEFLNAYFDGGEVAVQALQAKRLAVKQKYPKP